MPFQHNTNWRQTAPGLWIMMGKYWINIYQKWVCGTSSLKYK